jgi:outer membrane protein assembly factor BamB
VALAPRISSFVLLGALALSATPAGARRIDPDDYEAQDRLDYERDDRKTIREMVRGWTWAALPPVTYDDFRIGGEEDPDDAKRPLVRVTALAVTASGDAIVGGEARGPLELADRSIPRSNWTRGFIARVGRSGRFHMVHLAEAETFMVPSALAVDRAGRIVVSYEHGSLEVLTPDGRHVWSRDLPPARALAFARTGDILAAGCRITRRLGVSQMSKNTWHYDDVEDGYFARVSPGGEIRWTDRLDRGVGQLFYRPNDRPATDCATGIATGPGGDIYVAGDFVQRWSGRTDDRDPQLPVGGSFLARVADDGRIAWSRLVASGSGRVALAATRDGSRVVVSGNVARVTTPVEVVRQGLAAFDADGMPIWSLPIEKAAGREPNVDHLRVVARAGQPTFVCVGSYDAAIEVGPATLDQAAGGIFRLDVDASGAVKSLRDVPGKARPKGASIEVRKLALAPGAAGFWIGGTMRWTTDGGWLHAVPW